jgi:hypothetical protein
MIPRIQEHTMHNSTRLWLALQLAVGVACSSAAVAQTPAVTPPTLASTNDNSAAKFGPDRCIGLAGAPRITENEEMILDAPYSGVGVTEVVNMLADGNRITRKNIMRYFRDSRSRTRTEFHLATLGPAAPDVNGSIVVINDLPAKVRYTLFPEDKKANALSGPGLKFGTGGAATAQRGGAIGQASAPAGAALDNVVVLREGRTTTAPLDKVSCAGQSKAVLLGERFIEGLKAVGSKLEIVIPAGEMGNELPLTVTTEQWFSPELGVVLSSTHQDPRVGRTTYRLTQISRAEPDAKLFAVPADYKLNRHVVTQERPIKRAPAEKNAD